MERSNTPAFVLSPAPAASLRAARSSFTQPAIAAAPLLVSSSRRVSVRMTATAPKTPSWTDHSMLKTPPPTSFQPSSDPKSLRYRFERMVRDAQDSICAAIEQLDGKAKFQTDAWTREGGGGGLSRVLRDGAVFEKAGVNVSVVYGTMPPEAVQAATAKGIKRSDGYKEGEPVPFFACGVSSVMHPWNPMAPTVHFNYRFFETAGGVWWFGGGTDLTPSYLFEEDVVHFHSVLKKACDKHDPTYYPTFKKWCDEYFLIKHRGETRGVGGIFFDDLNDKDPEALFPFSRDCANAFIEAYIPIMQKRKDMPYTAAQKEWQQIRRGRYVEYNLVYDRGTVFGLKTGGRIESILMSLPLTARWEYDHHPEPGSWEAKLLDVTTKPKEWVH